MLVIIINILPEIHKVIKSLLPAIYVEDDKELLQPEIELPDDFYSTNYFTDKAIEFIKETPEGKPFFGMITYTAPHWPYQAPQDKIAKYNRVYDNGPEELRQKDYNLPKFRIN